MHLPQELVVYCLNFSWVMSASIHACQFSPMTERRNDSTCLAWQRRAYCRHHCAHILEHGEAFLRGAWVTPNHRMTENHHPTMESSFSQISISCVFLKLPKPCTPGHSYIQLGEAEKKRAWNFRWALMIFPLLCIREHQCAGDPWGPPAGNHWCSD